MMFVHSCDGKVVGFLNNNQYVVSKSTDSTWNDTYNIIVIRVLLTCILRLLLLKICMEYNKKFKF